MPRDWLQVGLYLVAVVALAWPLGRYLAAVLEDRTPRGPVRRALRPVERGVYALARVDEERAMDWREYARAFGRSASSTRSTPSFSRQATPRGQEGVTANA